MTQATLLVGASQSNQNLFYKTRFLAGDPFVYFETADTSLLLVSSMERGRALKESIVPDVRTFDDFGFLDLLRQTGDRTGAFIGMLVRLLTDLGHDRIQVEATFPVIYADALRASGLQLQVEPQLFTLQRRRKAEGEIEAIEAAQRATERAMARAVEMIGQGEEHAGALHIDGIPLTSERVRGEIQMSFLRDNMDTDAGLIVAGGPGAADPHWEGSGPLRPGEAIVMDLFPRGKQTRYYADMTRTVVKGTPSETLRGMYAAVSDALDAALGEIRAGANGRSAHDAVKAVFARAGFAGDGNGPRFIHGTGHGLGLDIHEAPSLSTIDMDLVEGDVVTVEPGLYDPAVGGIRIEDLVVVTADGYRNLTHFDRRFEL
jgi:Xaa-Pro aminopeptidase